MSAPATTASPGSTGASGTRQNHGTCSDTGSTTRAPAQCTQDLDPGQHHLDRLRDRPRPGLRYQEHDADRGKRRRPCSRPTNIYWAVTTYCKTGNNPYLQPIVPLSDNCAALKTSIDRYESDRQHQPGDRHGMGLDDAWRRARRSMRRPRIRTIPTRMPSSCCRTA